MILRVTHGSTQPANIPHNDGRHALHGCSADNTVHPSAINGGTRDVSTNTLSVTVITVSFIKDPKTNGV